MERKLAVIIPSVRGKGAIPTIKSVMALSGFQSVDIIVAGSSCADDSFRRECRTFGADILFGEPRKAEVMPGASRNEGLHLVETRLHNIHYVLFVDDDIIVPEDFAAILADFLENRQDIVAVMGRVVSMPRTYWTQVIDYSNFWWLQVEKDINNIQWLGAGATLVAFQAARSFRFDETLRVNEDIDFFQRLARGQGRKLAVCAGTTCLHCHARNKFRQFVHYQLHNGLKSRKEFHAPKIGFRAIIIGIRNFLAFFKKAILVNRTYLFKRPHIVFGILLSTFIYQCGILVGIHRASKETQ